MLSDASKEYKVKSVDIKYHKVRLLAEQSVFEVIYCPTENMVADILTKPLGQVQFEKMRQQLGVLDVEDEIKKSDNE